MRRIGIILFFLITIIGISAAQDNVEISWGEVTFITSKNIYVRFQSTEGFEVGDTLRIEEGGIMKACLVITNFSTTSCVTEKIQDCILNKGDKASHTKFISKIEEEPEISNTKDTLTSNLPQKPVTSSTSTTSRNEDRKQRSRGLVSVSTNSRIDTLRGNRHNTLARVSYDIKNIGESKFSFSTYANYRINDIQNADNSRSFARIYNLALNYQVDSSMWISLGRSINRRASSLGAIDGLQAEKILGKVLIGGLVGSRPDIATFNYNPNLLEYGVYTGFENRNRKSSSSLTVGFLEQRNGNAVDRRYSYMQFTSYLNRKINLFTSAEVDMYNKVDSIATNNVQLTNLYAMIRYKFSYKFNVSLSYDTRKRIIFYETQKTDIERLLDDDEARQGLRIRMSLNPIRYTNLGASYSKRFQVGNDNVADNYNFYAGYSKVPGLGGRLTANYNINTNAFRYSNIISVRYNQNLLKKSIDATFYYRRFYSKYKFSEAIPTLIHYYGTGLNIKFAHRWALSLLGEMSLQDQENKFRINTKIYKRFGK